MTPHIIDSYLNSLKFPRDLKNADPMFSNEVERMTMSVRELQAYMQEFEIHYFYQRKETLKKTIDPYKSQFESNRPNSAGSDVYTCNLAGKCKALTGVRKRKRISRLCGCPARFVINYEAGYKHTTSNELNVDEFGHLKVKISWRSKHNHSFNDLNVFPNTPLSKEAKEMLRIAVVDFGLTWYQVQAKQTEVIANHDYDDVVVKSWELFKIKSEHVRYQQSKQGTGQGVRHTSIIESLNCWAELITLSEGFAQYTSTFQPLDEHGILDSFKSSRHEDVWSFCFMSKWQRKLLMENSKMFHLHATRKPYHGLKTDENVSLFTLYVKNQITRCGAPAAFMLTNAGKAPVIADFLRKVRDFAGFSPTQAVIDCDDEETSALKVVWGANFPIIYCHFHVKKAFVKQLNAKIQKCHNKTDIMRAISRDFERVLKGKNPGQAFERMNWFTAKYEAHTEFIQYVKNQWFSRKQFIIEGFNEHIVNGHSVESFHSVLKSNEFLGEKSQRRPDVLVHMLFTCIAPSYAGKEWRTIHGYKERVHDRAESESKSRVELLSDEKIMPYVFTHTEGKVTVNLFCDTNKPHLVSLEIAGQGKNACTCPANTNSLSWCEHMFIAERAWNSNLLLNNYRSQKNNFDDYLSSKDNKNELNDFATDPTSTHSSYEAAPENEENISREFLENNPDFHNEAGEMEQAIENLRNEVKKQVSRLLKRVDTHLQAQTSPQSFITHGQSLISHLNDFFHSVKNQHEPQGH